MTRQELVNRRSITVVAAGVAAALLALPLQIGLAGAPAVPHGSETIAGGAAVATTAETAAAVIERFTATAVNLSGIGRASAGTLEIGIERWSTDAERDRLVETLTTKGQEALLDQLRDLPRIGYIRTPTSLGWDLHFARSRKLDDGGRQVVIATDRPMGFREVTNRPRSIDYPFTLLQIHFDGDGKGVGKAALASKITYKKDTGTIEIENFGIEPVRLTEVRVASGS